MDFLDNHEVTGKTCCDIREGKCTWFSCQTMEKLKADLEKQKQFEEAYGNPDSQKVEEAKRIMEECDLINDFEKFQETMITKINQKIDDFPIGDVKPVFRNIFQTLLYRKK